MMPQQHEKQITNVASDRIKTHLACLQNYKKVGQLLANQQNFTVPKKITFGLDQVTSYCRHQNKYFVGFATLRSLGN